jgi:hypothetical protein
MSHLSPERLAALIDEQPTAAELAHLASCRPCSRERGAYEALAAMAKTGPSLGQPLTSWEKLSPALVRDGVIAADIRVARRGEGISRGIMRAAAAVLLVAGGAFAGRMTAPRTGVGTRVADLTPADVHFASVEDAQAAAARSQNIYQASLAYLAGQDTVGLAVATPAVIKARLAALEQVSRIAGAALENAPYDPVVNTLYLNAQGQREASMRMLNTASTRLTTY